jgi:hypothetical protein
MGSKYATHCKQGHEFTKENTYLQKRVNGKYQRRCKKCSKWWSKMWRVYREGRKNES